MLLISKWTFPVLLTFLVSIEVSSALTCTRCDEDEPNCDGKEICQKFAPDNTLLCTTMSKNGKVVHKGCLPRPKDLEQVFKDGCDTKTWKEWGDLINSTRNQAGSITGRAVKPEDTDNIEYCNCNTDYCNSGSAGVGRSGEEGVSGGGKGGSESHYPSRFVMGAMVFIITLSSWIPCLMNGF